MCIWLQKKKKHTHTFHMLPVSFEWLFSLVKVLLSLSPSISFSHIFISLFQSFIFTISTAAAQGRLAIP